MANGKPGAPMGHPKWGGRPKGGKNKATREREAHLLERLIAERLTEAEVATLSAVQVLCRIMRAEVLVNDWAGAKQTAAILAPYQSPRLAQSDVRITDEAPVRSMAVILAEIDAIRAVDEGETAALTAPVPGPVPAEPAAEERPARWRHVL